MLMSSLEILAMNNPLRRRFLESVNQRYYEEFFNDLSDKRVLEIGCGNGTGVQAILKYFAPKKIIATDLDPRMIALARKNVQNPTVKFEIANATHLPYKDQEFAAVFDYITIHHIPAPRWKSCLTEVYRVLAPGGKFFTYEVSIESFATPFGKILKVLSTHPYKKMYKQQEFKDYLRKVGFQLIKEVKDSRHFIVVAQK